MSEKKALRRETKAVWDSVKRLRADHAKSYAPEAIEASAEQLERNVGQLRDLAKRLSALNAMPPDARPEKPAKESKKAAKAAKRSPSKKKVPAND